MIIKNTVTMVIMTPDPSLCLEDLIDHGVNVSNFELLDMIHLRITIPQNLKPIAENILLRRADTIEEMHFSGPIAAAKKVLGRPILLLGAIFLVFLTVFLPTRVLFFTVSGNNSLPDNRILEAAEQSGLHFFSSRRDVRSEQFKNALLQALPELKWAGVVTKGCCAQIQVEERDSKPDTENFGELSREAAYRDAVVLSVTATSGSVKCKVGQAVVKGQTLISGYTDCGLLVKKCRAQGEVLGLTRHELQVKMPLEYMRMAGNSVTIKKYSLVLGKKWMKLQIGSGILDTSCDRMYEEKKVYLPGGLCLPVRLIVETYTLYDSQERLTPEDPQALLKKLAADYVCSNLISGKILSSSESYRQDDSCTYLSGIYLCQEIINRRDREEILIPNGNTN